ncbi:MAG: hypothetical protein AB8I08_16270 [Sandaracinaceae bacterium]
MSEPPCDAFAWIERPGSTRYVCNNCGRRFTIAPRVALAMLASSVVPLVWILWIAPVMWPVMLGLAAVPLGALAYALHVRRAHPLADEQTRELLRRGLLVADDWVQRRSDETPPGI